ncbi:hypothetical protein ACQ4PT_014085 [Festuca glaucescens]
MSVETVLMVIQTGPSPGLTGRHVDRPGPTGPSASAPSTFACTGMVVDHEGSTTWIMTSATLVRKGESGTEVHELPSVKIEVLLHNKKVVNGQVLMYDLHYNVAIVSIDCVVDLLVVVLSDLPNSYFLTPSPVVAFARKFEPGTLQMKRGETFRTLSKLDCDELMVSTCPIEQKILLGVNFIDENNTPFLPAGVVGRCLEHFRKFGQIKQPWLGIRGQALCMLELKELEEICPKYRKPPSGILVDMIPEASIANCGGIEVRDIFNQLYGVDLHSTAQVLF